MIGAVPSGEVRISDSISEGSQNRPVPGDSANRRQTCADYAARLRGSGPSARCVSATRSPQLL
jgi:hypothetical protein